MKKNILFVLAVSVCFPFAVNAASVFNDAQSFQMAKAVKVGREKGGDDVVKKVKLNNRASDIAKKDDVGCPVESFKNAAGDCIPICDGTVCKKLDSSCTGNNCERYQKHPVADRCYCY